MKKITGEKKTAQRIKTRSRIMWKKKLKME